MLYSSRPKVHLILVAYYVQSIAEVKSLISDFEYASRIKTDSVIIVNNGGTLPLGDMSSTMTVIPGSNDFWEFSGWLAGLNILDLYSHQIIVLLNDSYRRNWNIKWPGRHFISLMMKDALRGKIASWLDNFTRTTRRINSRIVIFPSFLSEVVKTSLEDAILTCRSRQKDGRPLHDELTANRLKKWITDQDGRWDTASISSRAPRIFVEHHLLNSVPKEFVSFRPRTWIGGQFYGMARKLMGERR